MLEIVSPALTSKSLDEIRSYITSTDWRDFLADSDYWDGPEPVPPSPDTRIMYAPPHGGSMGFSIIADNTEDALVAVNYIVHQNKEKGLIYFRLYIKGEKGKFTVEEESRLRLLDQRDL